MTQPYTARQLDFFKTTLKILDSAVFKTGLPISDVTESQETPPTSKTEVGHTTLATHVDVADPTPAFNKQPEAIAVTLPTVKTSKVFFQSLPWQRSSTVASTTETASSKFAAPASLHEADIISSTKATTAQTAQTSTAFFKSLPWHSAARSTAQSITADKDSVKLPVADSSALVAEAIEKTSMRFFTDLPWQGKKQATKTTDFIATMNSEDVTAIANLATLTALQAAQRSTNKYGSTAQQTAGGFFQALPW